MKRCRWSALRWRRSRSARWRLVAPASAAATRRRPSGRRLALLTSLPLVFGESFGLDGGGSPALHGSSSAIRSLPIGVADAASLKGRALLLMAHPRAQPAEALVELDEWVRGGGQVLLLADPQLDWQSERPLGDRLRPPPAFADTGLLEHWGLRLTGPTRRAGRRPMAGSTISVTRAAGSAAGLRDRGGGFVARCRIGQGRATVIADADFLNVEPRGSDGRPTTISTCSSANSPDSQVR